MDAYCQRQGVNYNLIVCDFLIGFEPECEISIWRREDYEGADPDAAWDGEWGRDWCCDRADWWAVILAEKICL